MKGQDVWQLAKKKALTTLISIRKGLAVTQNYTDSGNVLITGMETS